MTGRLATVATFSVLAAALLGSSITINGPPAEATTATTESLGEFSGTNMETYVGVPTPDSTTTYNTVLTGKLEKLQSTTDDPLEGEWWATGDWNVDCSGYRAGSGYFDFSGTLQGAPGIENPADAGYVGGKITVTKLSEGTYAVDGNLMAKFPSENPTSNYPTAFCTLDVFESNDPDKQHDTYTTNAEGNIDDTHTFTYLIGLHNPPAETTIQLFLPGYLECAQLPASNPDGNPVYKESNWVEYKVSGTTLSKIASNIDRYMRSHGMTHVAEAESLPPQYSLAHDSQGNVKADGTTVTVEIVKKIPKLDERSYDRLSQNAKAEWNRFIEAVKQHESEHVSIIKSGGVVAGGDYVDGYNGILNEIACKTDSEAHNTINQISSRIQNAHDYFDSPAVTDHGKLDGAVLNMSIK